VKASLLTLFLFAALAIAVAMVVATVVHSAFAGAGL